MKSGSAGTLAMEAGMARRTHFLCRGIRFALAGVFGLCFVAVLPAVGQQAHYQHDGPAVLPDPAITPGKARTTDKNDPVVCGGKSTKTVRKPGIQAVYKLYGMDKSKPFPACTVIPDLPGCVAGPTKPSAILTDPSVLSVESMTSWALSPSSFLHKRIGTAHEVDSVGDSFQVFRIDAQGRATQMVKFFSFGDWTLYGFVDFNVGTFLPPSAIPTAAHWSASPEPTPVWSDNNSMGENPSERAENGSHKHPSYYEIDHLISLELGGANDPANEWPQPYLPKPGAHEKDAVENWLHAQVCSGKMPLIDAQKQISTDWYKVYLQMPKH